MKHNSCQSKQDVSSGSQYPPGNSQNTTNDTNIIEPKLYDLNMTNGLTDELINNDFISTQPFDLNLTDTLTDGPLNQNSNEIIMDTPVNSSNNNDNDILMDPPTVLNVKDSHLLTCEVYDEVEDIIQDNVRNGTITNEVLLNSDIEDIDIDIPEAPKHHTHHHNTSRAPQQHTQTQTPEEIERNKERIQNDQNRSKIRESEEKTKEYNEKLAKVLRQQLLERQKHNTVLNVTTMDQLQNNMVYHRSGIGRECIHSAAHYPPEWSKDMVMGATTDINPNNPNVLILDAKYTEDGLIYAPRYGIMTNTTHEVETCGEASMLHIVGKAAFVFDPIHNVNFTGTVEAGDTSIIPSKRDKWYINVPIRKEDGTRVYVKMLADGGANIPCVNTNWAIEYFKQFIMHNNTQARILTAGAHIITPKYVMWLTFPTKSGKLLKAKFFLVDNLPVDILADINMLREFGYTFKDETPPQFEHKADYDDRMNLKDYGELHKINQTSTETITNLVNKYKQMKIQHMSNDEEYNRARHTHFVQLAAITYDKLNPKGMLIKDGSDQAAQLLDASKDQYIRDGQKVDQAKVLNIQRYETDMEPKSYEEPSPEYSVHYTHLANTDTNHLKQTDKEMQLNMIEQFKDLESGSESDTNTNGMITVSKPIGIEMIEESECDTDTNMVAHISTVTQTEEILKDDGYDTDATDPNMPAFASPSFTPRANVEDSETPFDVNIMCGDAVPSQGKSKSERLEQHLNTLMNIMKEQSIPIDDILYDKINIVGITPEPITSESMDNNEETLKDPTQSPDGPLNTVEEKLNDILSEGIINRTEDVLMEPTLIDPIQPSNNTEEAIVEIITDETVSDSDDDISIDLSPIPQVNTVDDIKIPGIDEIDRQQAHLLGEIKGIEARTKAGIIQPITTQYSQFKIKQPTNNSALRRAPTGARGTRIKGSIGGTSVQLLNQFNCNYAVAFNQFRATPEEIKKAALLKLNEELKFNKLDYLKELEAMYPRKYMGLYKGTIKLIDEFKHIFAKRLFDRRTLKNVEPAKLGVLPEYRNHHCFIRQYNIPPTQRLHMIQYTQHNDQNGFWTEIDDALNCIPYTMVPKKTNGVITRWRPAFDARRINQWCTLLPSWMPTMRDFDEFFALKGLITIADCKNFFDCIPLHQDDWKWAVVMTPLGLRMMKHLTYGWKNAAPIAQNIMNKLCLLVGWMLGFIDDMAIKHPEHYTTKQLLAHLRKLFVACDALGLLLHPSKFWPFAMAVESLGILRTLMGSRMTEAYKRKILKLKKPEKAGELRSIIGIVEYVARYLEDYAFYKYWLLIMIKGCKKGDRINWTPQGHYAWDKIMQAVRNAKLLYNPTRNGRFCIKTDASKYGLGAVLYQRQFEPKTNKWRWVIIDMYSAVIKEDLRKSHSMTQEALAIVRACEHWQFHLIKRKFLISCDNKPIVHIFDENNPDYSATTRVQLARLRTQLNGYHFDIAHVPGVANELADGLSRFTAKFGSPSPKAPTPQPIISTDTGNKPLTKDELRKLEEKRNIQNKVKHTSHTVNHIALLMDAPELSHEQVKQQTTMMKQEATKQFNRICGDFKAQANHARRKRVRQFVSTFGKKTVANDEFQLNTEPCINLLRNMQPILLDLKQMSNQSLNGLNQIMSDANMIEHINNLHYIEDGSNDDCKEDIIEEVSNNEDCDDWRTPDTWDVNLVRNQYQSKESIPIDMKTLKMVRNVLNIDDYECYTNENSPKKHKYVRKKKQKGHHMQTRSKAKQKRTKTKPKATRVDFINPEGDEMIERTQTRDEFIHDLIGYRGKVDYLDTDTFRKYQETDVMLQTLRYLITNDIYTEDYIQDDKILLDVEFMKEYHNDLYEAWKNDSIMIKKRTGLLKYGFYMSFSTGYKDCVKTWVDIVPEILRGQILDYAHHNLSAGHLGVQQTMDSLVPLYWWDTMKEDVKEHVKQCKLCQYVKHGRTLKAPMRIRELPAPRSHVMADFLDCIVAKYHIMVIIDYRTNYCMLVPCERCDTRAVVDALLSKWIPVFGLFDSFETDFGSGFDNNVMKLLTKLIGVKHRFAEARNHRGIGKVERLVGYIQTIFNLYNVQSGNKLLADEKKYETISDVWKRVKAILPFIQQSLNRRRPRFTQYSPNMMMFGSELKDYGNIKQMIQALSKNQALDDKDENKIKLNPTDYEYLHELLERLKAIQDGYETDWKKYTKYSAKVYNQRTNIKHTEAQRAKILQTFGKGDLVLYYVGDRQVNMRKWRQRWSGPWRIKSVDPTTLEIEIEDDKTNNSKHVSVDRIKAYNSGKDTVTLEQYERFDTYQSELQFRLQNQYQF